MIELWVLFLLLTVAFGFGILAGWAIHRMHMEDSAYEDEWL